MHTPYLQEFLTSPEPDRTLIEHMVRLIEQRRQNYADGGAPVTWRPGEPLKLLLSCYGGGGNVGADIRVVEIIRQMRAIFGEKNLDLGVLVVGLPLTSAGFAGVRQEIIENYFPTFLYERAAAYHGVMACEGSLFKSNFSDAYSAMIAASLGLASAEHKPSVAYGAEAGKMSAELQDFVRYSCDDALILCRNEASTRALEPLGLRTVSAADTAWTFNPAPPARAEEILREHGWDGSAPVLCLCPVNPFWWPIRADMQMAAELETLGKHADLHYGSVFFHHHSEAAERSYRQYLKGFAGAITAALAERPETFPILVGMERLDRRACADLAALLPAAPPQFISGDYDMYDIVSLLRRSSLLVSSRFHAIVSTMPAQVPSIGISLDERIGNLMGQQGRQDLVLNVNDPNLEHSLRNAIRTIEAEREEVAKRTGRLVAAEVRKMGLMGMEFVEEIGRCLPDYERPRLPRSWEAHLPPLSPAITDLLEKYA